MATKMEDYNKVSSANEEESTLCTRCGENGHTKMKCRHIKSSCLICKKVGHLKSACKSKNKKDYEPSKQKEGKLHYTIVKNEKEGHDASRSEATFRYTVKNVSKMKGFQLSPPFYVRNLPWRIKIAPRNSLGQLFTFCLQCDGDSVTTSWSCYAVISLRLLSIKEGHQPYSRKFRHRFCSKENICGFGTFIYWKDVLDVDRGYIKDDTITLEAHVVANTSRGVGL